MTSRQVELITIGDELLLGFTVDTNAAYISRVLAAEGIDVVRRTTIGDTAPAIIGAVSEALARTGSVITTGGLGPTSDDVTRSAIAELFGRTLRLDEAMLADLEARWRSRFPDGRFPASNRTQAEVPEGAQILVNRHGTAPGLWLEDEAGRWVAMLPGVPREMRGILREELLPLLEKRLGSGDSVVLSRTLRTTGIAESAISELLGARFFADSGLGEIPLAYLPGVAGVDLRVTMKEMPRSAAKSLLDAAIVKLR
ncbi:MAG TPA: molybdopterin-binding protein, partial [Gemmatimonadaceae bacterium]|nr:molybdopterin-binding protein [Gemmatimonadaceae bacterium]